jgi:hypothetical protein
MNTRGDLQPVLRAEVKRWSSMTIDEILHRLRDGQAYEMLVDSKKCQVEVEILENTDEYIHVSIAIDDGALPASLKPLSESIILDKR